MRSVGAVAGLLLLLVGSCAAPPETACAAPKGDDVVYVVSRGWHVEVGVAADRLAGPVAVFRDIFPGAKAILFGYAKKTFVTSPPDTLSEYLLGPFPGPAVLQVTGLSVLPNEAYDVGDTVTLALPPGGARQFSDFIWNDVGRDVAGGPRLIGAGRFPGSLFYAARSGYSLDHTCNTWAANALHAAGLPIIGDGVIFSGQVMARVAAAQSCQASASVAP